MRPPCGLGRVTRPGQSAMYYLADHPGARRRCRKHEADTRCGVQMSHSARKGKMRSKLREAILAGFNPATLDEVLADNDMLRPNIAIGPDFATRVNSLIDVARQEGWLIELCGALAEARPDNQRVNSAIVAVQKWLMGQRNSDEVDSQFPPDVPPKQLAIDFSVGIGSLPLRLIMIAAVTLIGVAVWVFVDKKEQTQQSTISTTGDQSPVVTGTKGNVQIDMSKSPSLTATGGGVVIGRDAIGTTITTVPPNPGEIHDDPLAVRTGGRRLAATNKKARHRCRALCNPFAAITPASHPSAAGCAPACRSRRRSR